LPRVDVGSIVVDISSILGLEELEIRKVIEWALSSKPLLVVEPVVAIVSPPGSSRSLPIGLGLGSLIATESPPFHVRYYVVKHPFWANSITVGVREPRFRFLEGKRAAVKGVIRALDVKDPVALIVNGLNGEHVVNMEAMFKGAPIALLNDSPVLFRDDDGYATTLVEGEPAKRVTYMATLVSSAPPRAYMV